MEIKLTDKATKQLKKISKGNKKSAELIYRKLKLYADNQKGNYDIKKLVDDKKNRMRMKIGDYRVIYQS